MGLSRHERRVLRRIGKDMRRCDPQLASMLDTFGGFRGVAPPGKQSFDVTRDDRAAEGGDGGTEREKKQTARGKSPWSPGGYTPLILF
jgi:Protein of unknown function (DUF3040)